MLKVPHYFIFHPEAGTLEHYQLIDARYEVQDPDSMGRHWIPGLKLSLGVWDGLKVDRRGYWLRWWDQNGSLLPWGVEKVEQERQRAEQERQRAEQAERKAQALIEQLRALGVEPTEG
ncbi:MAG: hypothetical protein HC810_05825 [Acaryochloridaceae cyanobacterium RL_2_7]|nr:hypothetical protein [Acaryochloridaceae cyanobacterium RL_2_7]